MRVSVCEGGAVDEKHNLQCPRLQRRANPGWPVQLGAAVMLVSSNGRERTPEATLVCEEKCSLCGKESMCVHVPMCVFVCS